MLSEDGYDTILMHARFLGQTVSIDKSSKQKIRVFPLPPIVQVQPRLRTNFMHDETVKIDENDKSSDKNRLLDTIKGHVGPCVLRSLKYFDVGFSFLSNTLHNIYHGVMVSIFTKIVKIYITLCVFHCYFLPYLRRNAYCACGSIINTIKNHGHSIQILNRQMNICWVTSTLQIRQERLDHLLSSIFLKVMNIDLCYYVFVFMAFKSILPAKYYNHFLFLVVATHIVESR